MKALILLIVSGILAAGVFIAGKYAANTELSPFVSSVLANVRRCIACVNCVIAIAPLSCVEYSAHSLLVDWWPARRKPSLCAGLFCVAGIAGGNRRFANRIVTRCNICNGASTRNILVV